MAKKKKQMFLSLLLCATMVLSSVSGVEAIGHVHENEVNKSAAAESPLSVLPNTKEDIESQECTGDGSAENNGHHKLYSTATIVWTESGPKRAEQNQRVYDNSCEGVEATSSERVCQYCQKWFTVFVYADGGQATGHDFGPEEVKESSCDNLKYTTKTCRTCGFVQVTVAGGELDLSRHQSQKVTTTSPEKCETDVVKITECEDCGVVLQCEDLGQKGHTGHFHTTYNGDCQNNGIQSFECTLCHHTETREVITTGTHYYSETYITKPTCDQPGTATSECRYCHKKNPNKPDIYEVPATGHQWETLKSSPCGTSKTQRCKKCGIEQTVGGEGDNHLWGETIVVQPTCSDRGYSYHQCTRCGIKENIPDSETAPTGQHRFHVNVVLVPKTCGTPGTYQKKCIDCGAYGDVYTEPATGKHPAVSDDGDCTTPVICPVCHIELKTAQSDHNWNYTPIVNALSEKNHTKTCANPGCKATAKERCSASVDDDCTVVPKCDFCGQDTRKQQSHAKSGKYVPYPNEENEYHIELCNNCNQYYGQKVAHTYQNGKCTVCGHFDGRDHIADGKWQSDGNFHWQTCKLCGGQTLLTHHDKTADSNYEGDCTKAVKCSVCDYTVRKAAVDHSYNGEWSATEEFHYRTCSNPGCESHETADHTPISDGNCTTSDYCSECHYEVVKGGAEHSWIVDESGHTASVHKLHCSNTGCNAKSEAEHVAGIEATCCNLAECEFCHTEFGELNPNEHVGGTEIRNMKPATIQEEGYTGDTYCLGCKQMIEKGKPIEKLVDTHTHDYTNWASDGEHHWKVCSCGAVDSGSLTVHTFNDWTKTDDSTHSRTCSVCAYVESERHEHGEDPHDCTVAIKCVDCDAELVPATASEHKFEGRAIGTAEGHTFACVNPNCEVISQNYDHEGGSSSCQSGAHCAFCDFEYLPKDPSLHTGGTELRNYKEPTTAENGYSGDVYCLGCGELISNGTELEKLEVPHQHSFGDWKSDSDYHWKECECGAKDSFEYHSFDNGICTVCGKTDPSFSNGSKELVDPETGVAVEIPADDSGYYEDVKLVVDKVNTSDKDYNNALNTVGKMYDTFIPFNIKLVNTVTGQEIQPNGKITVKIPVPKGWAANKTLVYYINGSKAELVKTSISEDGAYITFTVDHLSLYVLANAESAKNADIPNTDYMSTACILFAAFGFAAVGIAAATAYKKKRRYN